MGSCSAEKWKKNFCLHKIFKTKFKRIRTIDDGLQFMEYNQNYHSRSGAAVIYHYAILLRSFVIINKISDYNTARQYVITCCILLSDDVILMWTIIWNLTFTDQSVYGLTVIYSNRNHIETWLPRGKCVHRDLRYYSTPSSKSSLLYVVPTCTYHQRFRNGKICIFFHKP